MEIMIKLSIDNPHEGNAVIVEIRDTRYEYVREFGPDGTHVYGYRFSACSDDPADWTKEALMSALSSIQEGHHSFVEVYHE